MTLFVSLGFAIGVFFLGPLLITGLFHRQIGEGWLNLTVEGVVRLALLVAYLYLIGRVPDIQRVFGYHGAEHKAINAMEHGDPLDIPHVRRASRVHTRCGTGFLLIVMVVSIFVFALVGSPSLPLKIVSRMTDTWTERNGRLVISKSATHELWAYGNGRLLEHVTSKR